MSAKGFVPKLEDKTLTITDSENGVVVFIDRDFSRRGPFKNFWGDYPYFLLECDRWTWVFINCLNFTSTQLYTGGLDGCEQLFPTTVRDVRLVDTRMYFTADLDDLCGSYYEFGFVFDFETSQLKSGPTTGEVKWKVRGALVELVGGLEEIRKEESTSEEVFSLLSQVTTLVDKLSALVRK